MRSSLPWVVTARPLTAIHHRFRVNTTIYPPDPTTTDTIVLAPILKDGVLPHQLACTVLLKMLYLLYQSKL